MKFTSRAVFTVLITGALLTTLLTSFASAALDDGYRRGMRRLGEHVVMMLLGARQLVLIVAKRFPAFL